MGIEIGSHTIKLIEVIKGEVTLNVQKVSLLETPKGCVKNGILEQIEPIKTLILSEIQRKKYRAKHVVMVVQSKEIIIRNAIMEAYPDEVIRQLLSTQTECYLPIKAKAYQMDYKVIKTLPDHKNELLLVAVPKKMIASVIELVEGMKKIPLLITTPSEAVGFVFSESRRMVYEAVGNILVLDIGGEGTMATIVTKSGTLLTRIFDFSIARIQRVLEEVQMIEGITLDEEGLKNIIQPQVQQYMIPELERILQFYYSSFENRPIKKIYLIGGGATIKGLKEYIYEAFDIPVEPLHLFSTVIESKGVKLEPYRRFFVNILGAINGL